MADLQEETVSILDRDNLGGLPIPAAVTSPPVPGPVQIPLSPIIVQEDDSPDIVLPLVVLIVFLAFIGWMLYLLITSGFQATTPEDPTSSDQRQPAFFSCPTGSCAINLLTGVKTCPVSEDESLPYNPSQSTCSSRFLCDNPLAPFALQSDGSTNINGVCEPNVECQCLQVSQCPDYVLSAFTSSNGNPYVSFVGQRITFPQIASFATPSGEVMVTPPIQFSNPSTTFCAAPISWLPFSNPGCNFIGANQVNSISYEETLVCTGMVLACDGFTGNACLQGVLAAVTDNPDTLTQANLVNTQFSCVAGEPCPCGTLPVYDTNFGNIVCRDLPLI